MAVALLAPAPEPRFVPVLLGDRHTVRDVRNGATAVPDRPWTAEDAERAAAVLNEMPGYAVTLDWAGPDDIAAVA